MLAYRRICHVKNVEEVSVRLGESTVSSGEAIGKQNYARHLEARRQANISLTPSRLFRLRYKKSWENDAPKREKTLSPSRLICSETI